MLAYVFWHTPRSEVAAREYERSLATFHEVLAAGAPPGFLRSAVFRTGALPWMPAGTPVYEDWYLVEGSAVLDPLNEAAVTGEREEPHRRAAAMAAAGTAGLYRLRLGRAAFPARLTSIWLAKPPDQGYPAFFSQVGSRAPECTVWGRQLVLGPTPEFCVHAIAEPPPVTGHVVAAMQRVWGG